MQTYVHYTHCAATFWLPFLQGLLHTIHSIWLQPCYHDIPIAKFGRTGRERDLRSKMVIIGVVTFELKSTEHVKF